MPKQDAEIQTIGKGIKVIIPEDESDGKSSRKKTSVKLDRLMPLKKNKSEFPP